MKDDGSSVVVGARFRREFEPKFVISNSLPPGDCEDLVKMEDAAFDLIEANPISDSVIFRRVVSKTKT